MLLFLLHLPPALWRTAARSCALRRIGFLPSLPSDALSVSPPPLLSLQRLPSPCDHTHLHHPYSAYSCSSIYRLFAVPGSLSRKFPSLTPTSQGYRCATCTPSLAMW
ncbi:hypothetical protein BJV77DRAFT_626420 [Russula vinacea]|nr:hypothetical protein BJV77DRAFT_626420 [Russula vinacea]